MPSSHDLLSILSRHIGEASGVSVSELSAQLGAGERSVRRLVEVLRDEGTPICAHPSTGYFIAATEDELERCCIRFLHTRAMTSLAQIARIKRISLPDYHGQLKLKT